LKDLIRAAQEALANVIKHAQASAVAITLSFMDDLVALDVRDDGRGFQPVQAASTGEHVARGFGLVAMRERVEQQGGRLIVESDPDEGTTLVVETDHIAAGYFDHEGTPQSDQIQTVERFTPNADYSRLDYVLTTTDPGNFTKPFDLKRYFVWKPENRVHPYDCLDRFAPGK